MDDQGSLNSGIRLQGQEQINPSWWSHGAIWQDFYNKVIIEIFHGFPDEVYFEEDMDIFPDPLWPAVRLINLFYSRSFHAL